MDTKSPTLIDAAAMAAQHPATFDRPTAVEIADLKTGGMAKVIAASQPRKERFWVQVVRRDGDFFVGRVDNDLVFTASHGLTYNDLIEFHADNICALFVNDHPTHSGAYIA